MVMGSCMNKFSGLSLTEVILRMFSWLWRKFNFVNYMSVVNKGNNPAASTAGQFKTWYFCKSLIENAIGIINYIETQIWI